MSGGVGWLGTAMGSAMESGIFDFGDEWAKLWLNTKQTVFVLPKLGPPPSIVAAGGRWPLNHAG